MAGMNYGKTVSSKNNINLSNIEIGNTSIANYDHSKINRTSNNDSSLTTTTTTLDLNALLTDSIDETVTSTKIADSHVIETPKEEKSLWDWVCTGASTYAVAYTSVISGVLDVGE